jgi:hypothetical protein
MISYISDFL